MDRPEANNQYDEIEMQQQQQNYASQLEIDKPPQQMEQQEVVLAELFQMSPEQLNQDNIHVIDTVYQDNNQELTTAKPKRMRNRHWQDDDLGLKDVNGEAIVMSEKKRTSCYVTRNDTINQGFN